MPFQNLNLMLSNIEIVCLASILLLPVWNWMSMSWSCELARRIETGYFRTAFSFFFFLFHKMSFCIGESNNDVFRYATNRCRSSFHFIYNIIITMSILRSLKYILTRCEKSISEQFGYCILNLGYFSVFIQI